MYFPLHLDVTGSKFLVFGAGNIAAAKIDSILEFTQGGQISVIAKEISRLHQQNFNQLGVGFTKQEYKTRQIKGFDVVIAATNCKETNRQIAQDAKKLGKLVNIVDDPKYSNFIFGANIKKSGVVVSFSTSGIAPVLARMLKQKIWQYLPKNLDLLSDLLQKNKASIRQKLKNIQARRLFYEKLLSGEIASQIDDYNVKKAQEILDSQLNNTQDKLQPAIYFISAGPGDPDLITVKAIKFLSKADVILYDRLVSHEILQYARRDAVKINVGKKRDFHKFSQDQINEMIKKYALEGKIVARLKGGDNAFFSRINEEIEAIRDLNIPYHVIAGVTAASGAAADMGIGLTSRNNNKSVRFLTLYHNDLQNDDYFKELAKSNDSLVLYMSSNNLAKITSKLLKNGANGDVKLAVVEQATTKYQKVYLSTILNAKNDFVGKEFASPSLVIIGDVVGNYKNNNWREENFSGFYFAQFKNMGVKND